MDKPTEQKEKDKMKPLSLEVVKAIEPVLSRIGSMVKDTDDFDPSQNGYNEEKAKSLEVDVTRHRWFPEIENIQFVVKDGMILINMTSEVEAMTPENFINVLRQVISARDAFIALGYNVVFTGTINDDTDYQCYMAKKANTDESKQLYAEIDQIVATL